MAKPGLALDNPMFLPTQGLPAGFANPYARMNAATMPGAGGLQAGLTDIAAMGAAARSGLASFADFGSPQEPLPGDSNIFFDPSRKRFYVNGVEVDEQDDRMIAETAALLDRPAVSRPIGSGWVQIGGPEYRQMIQSIVEPTRGTLFSKGFDIGVQNLKQLGGAALQLAGAEETGGRIVESAGERLEQLSPYQRQFTDVELGSADRGVIDWFVANLGQQGPMLLESVASGLAGAAVGTKVGGPGMGTAGGFLAGIFGRKTFKQNVLSAAAAYRAGKATKDQVQLLKNASALTGAAAATFASSQVIGAGDIYGEMREQGVGADDFGARLTALAGSFPYALAESTSEFLLAGRVLGGFASPKAIARGTKPFPRGVELLRRGAVGGGVGALAEGTTELAQESLVMGLSGQDLTSDEAVKRFINSFAAGAAIGGTVGGIANLRSTPMEEANLLDTSGTRTETRGQPGVPVGVPTQEAGFEGRPDFVAGAEGVRPSRPGDTLFRGQAAPGQFGPQGVLDLGGAAPITELQQRSSETGGLPPQQVWNPATMQWEYQERPYTTTPERLALPGPAEPTNLLQGELQFAPEAPTGIGFTDQQPAPNTLMAQQMQRVQRQMQEQQMRQQREAQLQQQAQQEAAQREADLAALQNQAAAQRELDFAAANQPAPEPFPSMPMRPAGPVQPQQLPLFPRRELPIPPKAGQLRRGGRMQPVTELQPEDRGLRQASLQLPLFNAEGEPTLPALRSAGTKTKVTPATPKPPAKTTRGARGLKKGARVAEIITLPTRLTAPATAIASVRPIRYGDGTRGAIVAFDNSKQVELVEVGGVWVAGQVDLGTDLESAARAALALEQTNPLPPARREILEAVPEAADQAGTFTARREAQLEAEEDIADKEKPSAVQEPSPAPVPPQPAARTGKEVGAEVSTKQKPAAKSEAKAETPAKVAPAKPAAPIAITLELADGTKVKTKDAVKLRDKVDQDITKFEDLLACLKKAL